MKRSTYFGRTWQSWVAWIIVTQVSTKIIQNQWHWAHHHYFIVMIVNVIIWGEVVKPSFHFSDIKKAVDVDA